MLLICLIINIFARASCPPCLIFRWVSSTPIDNQLLAKTFCSPSGDRLFVMEVPAGKRKDCALMRKPHPAHSGYQVRNPLHVIMGVCMPTSTTAIPWPCCLSRRKHDAPHSISLPGTAVPLRRLSGWDPPGGFVRRTRGLETMSYFLTIIGKRRRILDASQGKGSDSQAVEEMWNHLQELACHKENHQEQS